MGDSEDLGLPKATISRLISEMLPGDLRCSNELRDLIGACCLEFIHLVSSEANEVCQRDGKTMIGPDQVTRALQELGFGEYMDDVRTEQSKFKAAKPKVLKGDKKLSASGLTHEELVARQNEMFANAKRALAKSEEGYNMALQQQQQAAAAMAASSGGAEWATTTTMDEDEVVGRGDGADDDNGDDGDDDDE